MKSKLLFVIVICLISAYTMGQGYYIESFDVKINIDTDGTFQVIEELDVWFLEEKRGIIRSIPKQYNFNGEDINIDIRNIKVDGYKSNINNSRNALNLRIGDPDIFLKGKQKYIISYEVEGAYLTLKDHTEFYWNITGNKWDTKIENASFEISLPNNVKLYDNDIVAYSGKEGVRGEDVSFGISGNTVIGQSTAELKISEGISVAINLPVDFITTMSTDKRNNEDSGNSLVRETGGKGEHGFPFLVGAFLAFLIGAYNKYGINKGTKKKEEIAEVYYPPEDMNPAEVGTFYDFIANDRDLISLIPKWGNGGHVEVRSIPDHKGNPDLYFYKLSDLPANVPAYEKKFFDGLFKDGDQVFIADLKNKFYQVMAEGRKGLTEEVTDFRLYDEKSMQYFKRWPLIVGFILCTISGILIMAIAKMFITGGLIILTGQVILVFLIRRPKLTDEGVALHEQLVGLHKFLKDPQPQKLSTLIEENPRYLEQMFPYVVAFGLDKSWNKSINTHYPDYIPPAWYYAQNHDGSRNMNSSWSDFGTQFNVKKINSVFSSAPASSGGSSSGGFSGGSSGGGFGGGGGSSW